MGIKIILIAFILFAESRVVLRWRDKGISLGECALWTVLWAAAATIVIIPDVTSRAAVLVGVGRGADLVVYVGLAALFYAQFRQVVRIERMERDITELTRAIAIKQADENSSDTSQKSISDSMAGEALSPHTMG